MVYSIVLALHILNACATIAVLFCTLYVLGKEKTTWYYKSAAILAVLAFVQVVSGTLMATLNPSISPLGLSLHMALYLGICALAEALLILRIKNIPLAHLLAWARF